MKTLFKIIAVLSIATCAMADTTTQRTGLTLPSVSVGDIWGQKLNNNFTLIDSTFGATASSNTWVSTNTYTQPITYTAPGIVAGQCGYFNASFQLMSEQCASASGSNAQAWYSGFTTKISSPTPIVVASTNSIILSLIGSTTLTFDLNPKTTYFIQNNPVSQQSAVINTSTGTIGNLTVSTLTVTSSATITNVNLTGQTLAYSSGTFSSSVAIGTTNTNGQPFRVIDTNGSGIESFESPNNITLHNNLKNNTAGTAANIDTELVGTGGDSATGALSGDAILRAANSLWLVGGGAAVTSGIKITSTGVFLNHLTTASTMTVTGEIIFKDGTVLSSTATLGGSGSGSGVTLSSFSATLPATYNNTTGVIGVNPISASTGIASGALPSTVIASSVSVSVSSLFASASGSANYIQNGSTLQSATANISSFTVAGQSTVAPLLNTGRYAPLTMNATGFSLAPHNIANSYFYGSFPQMGSLDHSALYLYASTSTYDKNLQTNNGLSNYQDGNTGDAFISLHPSLTANGGFINIGVGNADAGVNGLMITATTIGFNGALSATSVTASGLTAGQCVQTGTGGLFTTTGSACGSGSGSGVTLSSFTATQPIVYNNVSGVFSSTLISATTGFTGTLQAAQEPAHSGDVTNTAGSLAMTAAATQANVKTFTAPITHTSSTTFQSTVLISTSATIQSLTEGTSTYASYASSGTITPDGSMGNNIYIILNSSATINIPSNAKDFQSFRYRVKQGVNGNHAVILGTGFHFGVDVSTWNASTSGSATDYLGCIYDAANSACDIVSGSLRGY